LDQGRAFVDTMLRLNHRHGDAWHPMVEVPGMHDRPEQDLERSWRRGRIFRCEECQEEILVESGAQGSGQNG
jgi:hypothetical protein